MLISTFAFSLMQLCVKYLSHLPAVELVLFRSSISLVLSLVFLRRIGVNPLGNNKTFLVLRGVFGVIALSMFFVTLQNIPLATAVTLQYLSPVFTAIFAIWMLGERMKPIQWLFFAIAFTGVGLIKGFDSDVELLYFILGLGSAVFAGLAYNCVRILRDSEHPVVIVFYFPLIATPIMAIASYFYWVSPQGWDWLAILLLGIFTQIGQVNMTKALQAETANKVTSLKYLGTLYALIYGVFIFDESYSLWSILGISLVLLGVVLNIRTKSAV